MAEENNSHSGGGGGGGGLTHSSGGSARKAQEAAILAPSQVHGPSAAEGPSGRVVVRLDDSSVAPNGTDRVNVGPRAHDSDVRGSPLLQLHRPSIAATARSSPHHQAHSSTPSDVARGFRNNGATATLDLAALSAATSGAAPPTAATVPPAVSAAFPIPTAGVSDEDASASAGGDLRIDVLVPVSAGPDGDASTSADLSSLQQLASPSQLHPVDHDQRQQPLLPGATDQDA